MQRYVIAITGATGAVFGIRLLEELRKYPVETHVVVSNWGEKTITLETGCTMEKIRQMSHHLYDYKNVGAPIASGSFRTAGMVIVPCSMKTLASITHGLADNLIARAADVMLKERRKLVLVPRETPLNAVHLENMLKASQLGAIIVPPMPAFYNRPRDLSQMVDHFVGRLLDLLDLENDLCRRWGEDGRQV